MSQHDGTIANQTFPNTRSDINLGIQALASNNSGATEPGTMFAYQWWHDTTNDLLKIRNSANTAWITVADIDLVNDRWELRSDILQAASTGGITLKNSAGTTIATVSNGGLLTTGALGINLGGPLNASSKAVIFSKGADVASASGLILGTDGNYFDITGTTTITSIATIGVGAVVKLHFDGALTLTHHATDLILPGGVDMVVAAGYEAEFVEYASGDWRLTSVVGQRPSTVFLGKIELSNDATAEFSTQFDSSRFSHYRWGLANVIPATDNTSLAMRTSADGGSTWDTVYHYNRSDLESAVITNKSSVSVANIIIAGNIGSGASEYGVSGFVSMFDPARSSQTMLDWTVSKDSDTGTFDMVSGNAIRNVAVEVNAVKFFQGAGNLESGFITMEGILKE